MLVLGLMCAMPTVSLAIDGEGGGGGGESGGTANDGSMGGQVGTWGGWNVERVTMLRTEVAAFLADRKSQYLSQPRAYEPVQDDIDSVTLVFLMRGTPVIEEGGSDDETTKLEKEAQQEKQARMDELSRQQERNRLQAEKEEANAKSEEIDASSLSDDNESPVIAAGTADITGNPQKTLETFDGDIGVDRYQEIVSKVAIEDMGSLDIAIRGREDLHNDEKALRSFVNDFNRSVSDTANRNANISQAIENGLGYVDAAGQKAQLALSFVPGVGWATSVSLDTARAGANAYRDGKTAGNIMSEMLTGGTTSFISNKLVGGSSFGNAKSVKAEFAAITKGLEGARTAYGKQMGGFVTGKIVETALSNKAPKPNYTKPTFDIKTQSFTTSGGHTIQR